jgi:hypothetical protein
MLTIAGWSSPLLQFSPAAKGWYNAAVLGGQGKELQVNLSASDYRYVTGIQNLSCQDNNSAFESLVAPTNSATAIGTMEFTDGTL